MMYAYIGRFDTDLAQSYAAAFVDALAEVPPGGDDVAPRILGVAEPAQSPRPGLGKPRTLRQIQCSPMLEQTIIDPA